MILVHLRRHMRGVSVSMSLFGSPVVLVCERVGMSGIKYGDKRWDQGTKGRAPEFSKGTRMWK